MRSLLAFLTVLLSFVTAAQDSLNVTKLFHWDDPTIPIGYAFAQNQYSAIWGYAADEREYAIIGSTLGTHIFDVTDPETSSEADFVEGRASGSGVGTREYKTYQHYLYAVCDQGLSSLQIIDMQYLPDSVHVAYDNDALVNHGHTLAIDTANARLYINGGDADLRVYDLSDPEQPVLLSNCAADVPWWPSLIGYVHDCHVRDNIVWTNDGDALHVIDFTNAAIPVLLGSLSSYPDQGYNHSSWLNDDGTVLVMADETHGSPLKFVDATDLSDLHVISSVEPSTDPFCIAHNPFFVGDIAHVGYYYDGYWAWNAADPTAPVVIGYYHTSTLPYSDNYSGAWGTYPFLPSGHVLVSDVQTGLWVLDASVATAIPGSEKAPGFRVWPTITADAIHVAQFQGKEGMVQVLDATGRLVATQLMKSTAMEIDLSALNDGAYLVRATSGSAQHVQRVVKRSEP